MIVGDDHRTPESKCLRCGLKLTGAFSIFANATPKPDDFTNCTRCGYVMAFDNDLRMRELTEEERKEAANDTRLMAAQMALAQWHEETKQ